MSLVKVQGNASGTGAFTIAAPNGNTDRTLTLPDATGTFNISGAVNEVPAGSVSAPSITTTGDTNTGIFFPAADTIAFTEGGVESMRITSAGDVGIGTSSPNTRLTVTSTGANGIELGSDPNNTADSGRLFFSSSSGNYALRNTSGNLLFLSGGVPGTSSGTERMRIDTSGNVGVGTSSPGGKLSVVGSSSATLGSLAQFTISGGQGFYLNSNSTGTLNTLAVGTGENLAFNTGASERARIDSSGNVGIGATSLTAKLQVNGTGSSGTILAQHPGNNSFGTIIQASTTGGTDNPMISLENYNGGSPVRYGISCTDNGSLAFMSGGYTAGFGVERARIESGGAFILDGSTAQKATGTTWSNPSDKRLKDNIRDYEKGLVELMQVHVCEWEYNGKGGTVKGTKGLGVVADEIMIVLPNTVENYETKLNFDDVEVTAIKKFDATEITWLLVKSIQEQQALITQLQADVAALKGQA